MMKVFGFFVIFVSICCIAVESRAFLSEFETQMADMRARLSHMGEEIRKNVDEDVKKSLDKALWFKGPNVCTDEKTEPKQSSDTTKKSNHGGSNHRGSNGSIVITNNGSTVTINGGSAVVINNQICDYANEFKLVCKSDVTENGKTEIRTRTYQCCEGYVGTYDENHARKCVP